MCKTLNKDLLTAQLKYHNPDNKRGRVRCPSKPRASFDSKLIDEKAHENKPKLNRQLASTDISLNRLDFSFSLKNQIKCLSADYSKTNHFAIHARQPTDE